MARQILAVLALNLRSMARRYTPSLLVVLSIGSAIGVFVAMWAMAAGFEAALTATGSANRALVLRAGSTSEINGNIPMDQFRTISSLPQVSRQGGQSLAAMETFVTVNLPIRGSGNEAVPMRGISEASYKVRPEVRLIAGRRPDLGKFEILVGRTAVREFDNLGVGAEPTIRGTKWRVSGIFAAADTAYESELWVPERILAQLWQRGDTFSSALVTLDSPAALKSFQTALAGDRRLTAHAYRESEYYANQAGGTSQLMRSVGAVVGAIMALGAIFATLNTLYAALSARVTEYATLRAVGFSTGAIAVAVTLEAALLGLMGALLGTGIVLAFMSSLDLTTAAATSSTFTQVAFRLLVSKELVVGAVVGAMGLAVIGSLPAMAGALRLSVAEGLRRG